MQLIAAAEGERRGLYGGAVGYLGYDGNLDTAITIRSAVLKDGQAHVHTGAGIVAGIRARARVRGDRAQGRRAPARDRAGGGHRRGAASDVGGGARGRRGAGAAMILVIDNYDSFTFNLVQALQAAGADVHVVRNDAIDIGAVAAMADDPAADLRGIVISPGPGRSRTTPASRSARSWSRRTAGCRCSACASGCSRWRRRSAPRSSAPRRSSTARRPRSPTTAPACSRGMPPSFMAARYHSLAVDPATLPPELRVTAMSEVDRVIMGIRHVSLPLEGVQFHPESVLTPQGPHLLANFLRQAGEGEASRLDDVDRLVRDGRPGREPARAEGAR